MHHVFVDFENVQAIDLSSIGDAPIEVTVILGRSQKRLEVGLVQAMLKRPGQFRLIEMDFSGKNALDLALAWHLGTAAADDRDGSFHIISRDKDFDPLVAHLRHGSIQAFRHDRFSLPAILGGRPAAGRPEARPAAPDRSEAKPAAVSRPEAKPARPQAKPALAPEPTPAVVDKATNVVNRLRRSANPPTRKARLLSHIRDQLKGRLKEGEEDEILDLLVDSGFVAIDVRNRVTYPGLRAAP
jgi:hypothetical protein